MNTYVINTTPLVAAIVVLLLAAVLPVLMASPHSGLLSALKAWESWFATLFGLAGAMAATYYSIALPMKAVQVDRIQEQVALVDIIDRIYEAAFQGIEKELWTSSTTLFAYKASEDEIRRTREPLTVAAFVRNVRRYTSALEQGNSFVNLPNVASIGISPSLIEIGIQAQELEGNITASMENTAADRMKVDSPLFKDVDKNVYWVRVHDNLRELHKKHHFIIFKRFELFGGGIPEARALQQCNRFLQTLASQAAARGPETVEALRKGTVGSASYNCENPELWALFQQKDLEQAGRIAFNWCSLENGKPYSGQLRITDGIMGGHQMYLLGVKNWGPCR